MSRWSIIAGWVALATTACGACASGSPVVRSGGSRTAASVEFSAFACDVRPEDRDSDAELQARGAMLWLAQPTQSVTLRHAQLVDAGAGSAPRYRVRTLARIGDECPHDASQSTCRDVLWSVELSALASLGLPGAVPYTYLIAGTGNGFTALTGDRELRAILGHADTAAEAWFWLMRSTGVGTFSCGAPEISAHRRGPNGIELRVRRGMSSCRPLTEALITYRVMPDGAVVELHREIVRYEPDGCVVSW